MNFQRRMRLLNSQFASELGSNPHGHSNYEWRHTADLFYLLEGDGPMDEVMTDSGIYVMQKRFERHCWADMLGLCWVACKWQPSIPEDEWTRRVGRISPWPKQGEYTPICNIKMGPDEEPDERHTAAAIFAIRCHLGTAPKDAVDALIAACEKRIEDQRKAIRDEVHDSWSAGLNVPGTRNGSVSFPESRRDQLKYATPAVAAE